jgi:hypothetical protein
MSDLKLPSWVDQTPSLRQALTREAKRLRDYEKGKYGSLEDTARLHRYAEKAQEASKDLMEALQGIIQTDPVYVVADIGTEETRKARAEMIEKLDGDKEKTAFAIGMDFYAMQLAILGVQQKVWELTEARPKPKNRPSKFFSSFVAIEILRLLEKAGVHKRDADIILDNVFDYAGTKRPDRKTLKAHSKQLNAKADKREKAP